MTALTTMSVWERIEHSRNDFLQFVWPAVSPAFGEGRLLPVEGREDEVARQLDMLGIDYLFIPSRGEPYGVSQRTGEGQWSTVTMGTQALTRLQALWGRTGTITPAVHVQAYLHRKGGGEQRALSSVAVLRMAAFMGYVAENLGEIRQNRLQGTRFHSWSFDDLSQAGVTVLTLPAPKLRDPFGTPMEQR